MYNELSNADLKQLYTETFLTHNNEIVFCGGVNEGNLLQVRKVKSSDWDLCLPDDTKPFSHRLGYINLNSGTTRFLVRLPQRQYKLSLSNRGIYSFSKGKFESFTNAETLHQFLAKTKYPTFEEATSRITNKEVESIAFTPDFRITVKGMVEYRDTPVGVFSSDSGKIHFGYGFEKLLCVLEKQYEQNNQ